MVAPPTLGKWPTIVVRVSPLKNKEGEISEPVLSRMPCSRDEGMVIRMTSLCGALQEKV
jgi:hypothetical protein